MMYQNSFDFPDKATIIATNVIFNIKKINFYNLYQLHRSTGIFKSVRAQTVRQTNREINRIDKNYSTMLENIKRNMPSSLYAPHDYLLFHSCCMIKNQYETKYELNLTQY